ncbi:hypothetical protein EJB05_55426 [Eragrostis curvula]|uniref:Thaumatin-like protein n=1 Tax=Eragrostis curvula TaxID=38414 RepID=A0A5J9SJR0_9POAL|nr:hypothetical protein EJB05_55426 [Eragrostis curvula]
MARRSCGALACVLIVLAISVGGAVSKSFTIANNCEYTVWPGILSSAGSACEAFGSAQYCCNGEYGNPGTCKPSSYSQFFKNACPRAYSYAYDDATSTFTCAGGDTSYAITFCPSTTRRKRLVERKRKAPFGIWASRLVHDRVVKQNTAGERPHKVRTSQPPVTAWCRVGCENNGDACPPGCTVHTLPSRVRPRGRSASYANPDVGLARRASDGRFSFVRGHRCVTRNPIVKSAGSSSSPQGPGLPLMNDTMGMVYLGGDQLGAAAAGARPPSRLLRAVALAAVSLALAGAWH